MDKLKSRKLWVTVVAAAAAALCEGLGLRELAQLIIGLGASYNVGQGIADLGQNKTK